jgi:hypothetical protein
MKYLLDWHPEDETLEAAAAEQRKVKYFYLIDKGMSESQAKILCKCTWDMIEKAVKDILQ